MRLLNSKAHLRALLGFAACALLSCYKPDLNTQIYKCDRGKCPEDFYCIDNIYCTQQSSQCAANVGGIPVSEGVTVCVSAIPMPNLCATNTSTAKCDAMNVPKNLCVGIGPGPDMGQAICAYCCN